MRNFEVLNQRPPFIGSDRLLRCRQFDDVSRSDIANFTAVIRSQCIQERQQTRFRQFRTAVHSNIDLYLSGKLYLFERETRHERRVDLGSYFAEIEYAAYSAQALAAVEHLRSGGYLRGVQSADLLQVRTTVEGIHHIRDVRGVECRYALQRRTAVAHLIHRIERRRIEGREYNHRRIAPKELVAVADLIHAAGAVHQCDFIDERCQRLFIGRRHAFSAERLGKVLPQRIEPQNE